jgi:hypothetical protein
MNVINDISRTWTPRWRAYRSRHDLLLVMAALMIPGASCPTNAAGRCFTAGLGYGIGAVLSAISRPGVLPSNSIFSVSATLLIHPVHPRRFCSFRGHFAARRSARCLLEASEPPLGR